MSDELRITLVQQSIMWEDKATNRERFRESLQHVEQTDLIILPEMFTTGFSMHPEKLAEPTESDALRMLQETAAAHSAAITGSIIAQENGKYYNRLLWVYPNGYYATYDKRHLFRMSEENKHYTSGESRIIVNYKNWRILPLVCYDLRFPVWSRNDADYDLLIYVANWPGVRRHVWKTLLEARAMENQAFVAGVNRVGQDGNGKAFTGDSRLISAKGEVLSQIAPEKNAVETISISKNTLNAFRKKFPVDMDRDAFSVLHGNTYFIHPTQKD